MCQSVFLTEKPKMTYFKEEDILHLVISDDREADSIEISPNITAELNEAGELIGIEIINASGFLRDSVLETTQARLLKLKTAWQTRQPDLDLCSTGANCPIEDRMKKKYHPAQSLSGNFDTKLSCITAG